MSTEININPDAIGKDRYRMPVITAQSRKNNKTYLTNIDIVAKALHRTDKELLKFFGLDLSTQTNEKQMCVNGVYSVDQLSESLTNYIRQYVLCSKCGNPETKIFISKSKKLKCGCKACGHLQCLDTSLRYEKWLFTVGCINNSSRGKSKKKRK